MVIRASIAQIGITTSKKDIKLHQRHHSAAELNAAGVEPVVASSPIIAAHALRRKWCTGRCHPRLTVTKGDYLLAARCTLTYMAEGAVEGDEAVVAECAQAVRTGERTPEEFDLVFAQATVCGRRPARPGVEVVEVEGRGTWTFVFSTPQRLAAHYGDCDVYVTTGADLLEQLPVGIGVMLDPDDEHQMPILTRMVPPKVLSAMRRQNERQPNKASGPDPGQQEHVQ